MNKFDPIRLADPPPPQQDSWTKPDQTRPSQTSQTGLASIWLGRGVLLGRGRDFVLYVSNGHLPIRELASVFL